MKFLTNFDPSADRIHCFYEGREDEIFYRNFISSRTGSRVIAYICGNKGDVYRVCDSVVNHHGYRQSLFFVDKDLSDVMNEVRPTHARMFTTSYYSVENYLVQREVFVNICHDFIQCRGVVCDHEEAGEHFSRALSGFYTLILPIMAWIIAVRRNGQAPNLRNIKLQGLFGFDSDLVIRKIGGRGRISHLCTVTGITPTPGIARDIRRALVELRSHNPKCVVRGHFESWFFVSYMKALFDRLKVEAEKQGGTASMMPTVEQSNFVALAIPRIQIPPELDAFLSANV